MNENNTISQEDKNNTPTEASENETQKYELLPVFAEAISKIRQTGEQQRAELQRSGVSEELKAAGENYIMYVEEKLASLEEVLQSLPPESQARMAVGWHTSPHWQEILTNGLWQTKNRATIYNMGSNETMNQLNFSLFLAKGGEQRPVFVVVPKDFLSETGGAIVREPTEDEPLAHPAPERIKNRSKELGYIPPQYLL